MMFSSTFLVEKKNISTFASLLLEEDFDFSPRDCRISIIENSNRLEIKIDANSFIDFKIAINAFMKSVEIIEKTLEI